MNVFRPIFLFLFLLISTTGAFSQSDALFIPDDIFTASANYLPKDLLKTKSIVLIKMPEPEAGTRNSTWKKFAEGIHAYLRAVGIDAVWYFYFDDFYGGPDLSRAVSNALDTREIKYIIICRKKADLDYELYITAFNKNEYFFKKGQDALRLEANTLSIIHRELARLIDAKGLERENLMILETPEYFNWTSLIRGKRFEYYAVDLKLDKLAIPDFGSSEKKIIPINLPVRSGNTGSKSSDPVDTASLHNIFKIYPFEHHILPYDFDENALRKKGYQFVLLWIYETEPLIRHMLNYQPLKGNQKKDISPDPEKMVYKFYIKHIYTGDVYLGNVWDADPEWQKALENHLIHLIETVK